MLLAHGNKALHVQREQKCKCSVPEAAAFCPKVMGGGTGELACLDGSTFKI